MRCVRNFLRINIVAKDELPPEKNSTIGGPSILFETEENTSSPAYFLKKIMKEKGVEFDQLKRKLIKENFEKAESLDSVEGLPKNKMFELIERIKTIKA